KRASFLASNRPCNRCPSLFVSLIILFQPLVCGAGEAPHGASLRIAAAGLGYFAAGGATVLVTVFITSCSFFFTRYFVSSRNMTWPRSKFAPPVIERISPL